MVTEEKKIITKQLIEMNIHRYCMLYTCMDFSVIVIFMTLKKLLGSIDSVASDWVRSVCIPGTRADPSSVLSVDNIILETENLAFVSSSSVSVLTTSVAYLILSQCSCLILSHQILSQLSWRVYTNGNGAISSQSCFCTQESNIMWSHRWKGAKCNFLPHFSSQILQGMYCL